MEELQIQGQDYHAKERVAGNSLRAQMRPGRRWRASRAVPVLEAIAQALTNSHGRGLLHLDLKPENVLCARGDAVKITDPSLDLPSLPTSVPVETDPAPGAFDYYSPEQRYGLPLDPRSDVFSLAVLAYQLLTGRLPGRVYVPATRRNRSLTVAVGEALRRGLARDKNDRYPTAEEFRQALIPALELASMRSRRRAVLALAGALLAVLLGTWLCHTFFWTAP